ncbi:SDR family NAD(P)-dependent oxidoreductase [Paenibacillus endoradicis]|uniref:SDR family NAD(P)-dependent oxidoreductase n=1 Tax=Paenibacillus endoradicis TaxID=2972487 RepID=UPI0021598696|nr:SDR family NAD(P)-dependent oxidoreductase [Paenibacillus endoradicis]MCR8657748.1 SDR family NAD(P)-dependent oxidoreductase [Paenibacillus endoradicis]
MKGKIVLVVGASSGVGRAVSLKLASQGATVIISSRDKNALKTLKNTIEINGGQCYMHSCDICSEEAVRGLIDETINQFGKIDIAILSSAVQYVDTVDQLNIDEVNSMFQTNVVGIIRCTRLLLPHMMKKKSGQIALISSIMGEAAFPHMVSYGATKAAISCFARGLRREVTDHGIAVTLFSPGHMNTNLSAHLHDRIPLWYGKSGSLNVEVVAQKLVTSIRRKKADVVIGRQSIMLGNMIKFLPNIANNIIRKITT